MSKSAFGVRYTVKTSGIVPGRYDTEIIDAEFMEKAILFTPEARDEGIVGKEFNDLNEEQRKLVMDTDRISRDGNPLPKVADKLCLHLKELTTGTIMKWNNAYIIEMPYWVPKNRETGNYGDPNSFLNENAAPLSKEFYDFAGRVLGRELPVPGSQFEIGDLIHPGDKLSIEIDKDFKGFAKAKSKTAEPFGTKNKVTSDQQTITVGADAETLLNVLRENKDQINGHPKGDVVGFMRQLITEGKLNIDFPTSMNAWAQIRDQIINAEGNVVL